MAETAVVKVAGYASIPYYVRNDAPIKSIADLKGKCRVANALGGAADFGLRAVLLKHGLIDKRDYALTESAFTILLGGKADLVAMTAPFVYDPELKTKTHVLLSRSKANLGPSSSSSRRFAPASPRNTAPCWSSSSRII